MGFSLRLYTLNKLPLIIDEIGFAAQASDILHGQHMPIFAPYRGDSVAFYSWLLSGFMALFGQNPFAIRLLSLILGTLSIPALYVLGRKWWSRRVGLLAAAFLATYPAHIVFSRLSLFNIADPLFAMLTLALLARAIQRPSFQRYWILAGLMAGISQYFYQSSRLLLVLMAVYVVLSAVSGQLSVEKKWKLRTRNWKPLANLASWRFNILWMLLAFSIVVLPRFAPMLVNGQPLTVNEKALELPADFGANSLRALLGWVGQPDVSPFWVSDAPLLEWAALLLFALGVLVSLWRWRDPRFAVPLLSILLTTYFGGMIRTAAPLYVRYVTAVPAIALLVAVGIEAIKNVSQRSRATELQRGDTRKRYRVVVQIVVIGVIAVQGIYVAVRQPEEALGKITASQWIEQDLARQAAALPRGTAAVLIVPEDFNEVQRITIAHYIAAYGERRAIIVRQEDEDRLSEQINEIDAPYIILRPKLNGAGY